MYDYAWVEKPINAVLEPGEAYSAIVKIRPKELDGASRPGRLLGQFRDLKTPLTTEWCLASLTSISSLGAQVCPPVVSHILSHSDEADALNQPPRPSLAAMHIVQWKSFERSHQEIFIHIRGM